MTLTLTLREQPVVPLEADVLCPDRLAGASREEIAALPVWHGNERTRVGEFFAVSGAGDDVRLEGDLSRVKFVGAGMTAGRLTVAGDVGMHAGRRHARRRAARRGRRRRLGRRGDARRHARGARLGGPPARRRPIPASGRACAAARSSSTATRARRPAPACGAA